MSNKFEVGPNLKFEAFGDRLLIQEDEFRSGYECPACAGSGQSPCPNNCDKGVTPLGHKCSHCDGVGTVRCSDCQGKGGLLHVAEVSERRPTTGVIVSTGDKVTALKVGQSVLYSSYAGYTIDLNRAGVAIVLRVLHEPEILTLVEGHMNLRDVRGKSDLVAHLS